MGNKNLTEKKKKKNKPEAADAPAETKKEEITEPIFRRGEIIYPDERGYGFFP